MRTLQSASNDHKGTREHTIGVPVTTCKSKRQRDSIGSQWTNPAAFCLQLDNHFMRLGLIIVSIRRRRVAIAADLPPGFEFCALGRVMIMVNISMLPNEIKLAFI
jgi:hypothetical protein